MSELTSCNYCTLRGIRGRLKKGYRVTIVKAQKSTMGGLDVFVHPKDIEIDLNNPQHREEYFVAWFMALGGRCEC